MPLNTDWSGSELEVVLKLNLAGKSRVPNSRISKEGVIGLPRNDPSPNLLQGFIPPGEFAMVGFLSLFASSRC